MELGHQAENQVDARPTVNPRLPAEGPGGFPQASTSQFLRDDLDPHIRNFEQASLFRRALQTVKIFLAQAVELICSERINVLLVFAPIGITVGFLDVDPIVDFVLNALAIIPLAVVISTATESIASRLGDTLGALLNVTIGNTAELMIFFVALAKNQIRIVQASLLGSVLVNLLLVLGTAFWAGGLRYHGRIDDRPAAHLSVGLLDFGLLISMFPAAFLAATRRASADEIKQEVLSISRWTSIGLIVVYMFYLVFQMRAQSGTRLSNQSQLGPGSFPLSQLERTTPGRLPKWMSPFGSKNSRGQYTAAPQTDESESSLLRPSTSLEDLESAAEPEQDVGAEALRQGRSKGARPNQSHHSPNDSITHIQWRDFSSGNRGQVTSELNSQTSRNDTTTTTSKLHPALPPSPPSTPPSPSNASDLNWHDLAMPLPQEYDDVELDPDSGPLHSGSSRMNPPFRRQNTLMEMHEYRRHRTQQSQSTSFIVAVVVLVIATGIVSISTELAVDAIPPIVESWGVSQIFLGFIVLPAIGNAAEHIIAAKLALHNKMVLAKKVAVESGAQIVLFIMPVMIIIGWIRDRELSFQFDIFEIASIVMTSLIASILVCRGKADWKQGMLLHSIYLIVSLGAVVYPTSSDLSGRRRKLS